jgi:hypothetical protein
MATYFKMLANSTKIDVLESRSKGGDRCGQDALFSLRAVTVDKSVWLHPFAKKSAAAQLGTVSAEDAT